MRVLVVVGLHRTGDAGINGRTSWNVLAPVRIARIDSHSTKIQVSATEDKPKTRRYSPMVVSLSTNKNRNLGITLHFHASS